MADPVDLMKALEDSLVRAKVNREDHEHAYHSDDHRCVRCGAPDPKHDTRRGDRHKGTVVRLDRQLNARLLAAAEERGVSANWMLGRLVAEGLDALKPVAEFQLTRPQLGRGEKP